MTSTNSSIEVISIQIDSVNKTNLYVNNSNKIPVKKVVYDLFNSGQLFVNYPLHLGSITGVRDTMQTIYNSYVIKDSFMKDPNYTGNLPSWLERYVDSNYNGWAFDVHLIFTTTISSVPEPVCKSFTGQTHDNILHISKKYLFANKQNSITSNCSNSKVYVDKLVPHPCVYQNQFSSCPYYEYDYEVIESFKVNESTFDLKEFELRKINHQNNFVTYQVFDVTNNQINYVIYEQYSPQVEENAIGVMREVLSSYNEFSQNVPKEQGDTLSIPTKKSYILSLT